MGDQSFPRWIFAAKGPSGKPLSHACRLTLSALWSFARWWEDGDPWVCPGAERLAEMTGQAERSVYRQLKQLAGSGLIERASSRIEASAKPRLGWCLSRAEPVVHDPPAMETLTSQSVSPSVAHCPVGHGNPDPPVMETLTPQSCISTREESEEVPDKESSPEQFVLKALESHVSGEHSIESQVLREINLARVELWGKEKKNVAHRDTPSNRKLIRDTTRREGADLDTWRRVIRAQFEAVRGQSQTVWKFLRLYTITRPAKWEELLTTPIESLAASSASYTPSSHNTPQHGQPAFDELPVVGR